MSDTKSQSGWKEEVWKCWSLLENKAFFFSLLAIWLLLFQLVGNSTLGYIRSPSLFAWTYDAASGNQSEDGHVLLMPLAILALFWWKRGELMAVRKDMWSPALLFLAGSIGLHLIGYLIQQPRVSLVACFIGIYSLIGLAWGKAFLKASFFPCILFAFCIPVAQMGVLEKITLPLRVLATNTTYHFCNDILGFNVIRHGTQLFDSAGAYSYDVAAACSGIRSLIALIALMLIYGVITFRSFWKRAAMVVISIPLAIFCNILRLGSVVVAAETFGQKAGDLVHEWSGFLTYAIALVMMFAIGHFWRDKEVVQTESAQRKGVPA